MKAIGSKQSAASSNKIKYGIQRSAVGISILAFMLYALCALPFVNKASAELTMKTDHDRININLFYHGATLNVSGLSNPADSDLIIKITSAEGLQSLRKKVKVAGLFWMNGGEMKFEHSPLVYFLSSTKKLGDILSQEEMDKYLIGYPSLGKHIDITPVANENERTKFFNEFVKFKENSHLFYISPQPISTTLKDGKQDYSIKLDWPYQAPPDNYLVTVYAVKDKKVIGKVETNVVVEQVGIVKTLSDMAHKHGALYGLMSMFGALTVGFIVAVVFPKRKGGH